MVRKILKSWETFRRVSHLILIWAVIGIIFGILYYYLPEDLINIRGEPITNILGAIYFSFISLLTTGYGDIVAVGFIRALTVIEGLIGWIIFGIIVYRIVAVRQDVLLNELHNVSNEQYISRVRNNLFISNTNLTRFINSIKTKKIAKLESVYELGIISTTLEANIADANRFLCKERHVLIEDIDEEDLLLITRGIELCLANLIRAISILPLEELRKDAIFHENVNKIVNYSEGIYNVCNIKISSRKIDDLKHGYEELRRFVEWEI